MVSRWSQPGGGCKAWIKVLPDDCQVWITDESGCDIPIEGETSAFLGFRNAQGEEVEVHETPDIYNRDVIAAVQVNGVVPQGQEALRTMTNTKQEAIANADAILNNVGLPTYTELRKTLGRLNRSCDGDSLGTVKAPDWQVACEAATIEHAAKGH